MDSADAFAALGEIIGQGLPQAGVFALNQAALPARPLFTYLADEVAESAESESLLMQLEGLSTDAKHPILVNALSDQLASTLGIAAHRIDVEIALTYIGMDSLMAIELRNWLRTTVQVEVTIPQLLEDISIRQLARVAAEQLADMSVESTAVVDEFVSLTI